MPAVVHVSYDLAVRGHDGACSGGGNTQEEHHLAAQELSYTRAQDFTAISLPIEDRMDHVFLIFAYEVGQQTSYLPLLNHICYFRRSV